MAYLYSDWITQSTNAARLTRLRQHIAEVTDKIGNETSAQGYSEGSSALQSYLAQLMTEVQRLERIPGSTGCSSNISMRRR